MTEPFCAAPGDDGGPGRVNALTVDIEDYFQVEAFSGLVPRERWNDYDWRVEDNTGRILDLFAACGARATFFTLGSVAERFPRLIRRIVADGHEVASHGQMHYLATTQTPEAFRADVEKAKQLLEDLTGEAVLGYRAPSFSIGRENQWAFRILAAAGYRYSSSVYPIRHDIYGIPDAPRFAYRPLDDTPLHEFPGTTIHLFGQNLPCGGGGYFRIFPYVWSRWAWRRLAARDHQPCIFYFHPWEIDPGQPHIEGAPLKSRLRHYTGLRGMEGKIRRALNDFSWAPMREVFSAAINEDPA